MRLTTTIFILMILALTSCSSPLNKPYDEETIEHVSWLFSGDNDEQHQSIKQTWKRLNETVDNFKERSKAKNSNNP